MHPSCVARAAFVASGILLASSALRAADLCTGLITDKLAHPMTALPKPAVGEAVVDPQFGTTIRRITAVPVVGQDPVIKPMYSTISAWNADESLLLLYRVGYTHQLYDGRTYAFIRNLDIAPADIEQVYWHTSDPDILFYVEGNRLIRYHVSTDTPEVVRTFTFCTWASGGSDPMFTSWDSNRIGLQCDGQVFVYDIAANAVLGLRNSNSECPKAAPSGALTYWNGAVTDAQLNVLRQLDLSNPYEHASLGRYANGHDTYNGIAYEPGPAGSGVGSLVTHDLTDGVARVIVGPSTGYPYPPPGHVSALSYRAPGWVTLSIGGTAGQTLLDNELLMADTNTGVVCRAAHHRSWGRDNTHLATPYWAEPHAVASPSGTRIVFGSDWGNSPSVDTYVLELPSYAPATFADVPSTHWAWRAVEAVHNAGITSGCATNPPRFCPDAQVSRAQMAVFLLRAREGAAYVPPPAQGLFDDVPASDPFAAWIEEVANRGVATGCSANPPLYCPNSTVTRAQMAPLLLVTREGSGYVPAPATGVFQDVPASDPFARWIEELVRRHVTGGCGVNPPLYCPGGATTRAQMAVFLASTFALPLP